MIDLVFNNSDFIDCVEDVAFDFWDVKNIVWSVVSWGIAVSFSDIEYFLTSVIEDMDDLCDVFLRSC